MSWWLVLLLLLFLYLLAALVPWVALQILEWLLRRSNAALSAEGTELQRLVAAEHEQSLAWPTAPRPGRYQEPDRQAQEALMVLRHTLKLAQPLWLDLTAYVPARVTFPEVATVRAWSPLLKAIAIWRVRRAWREHLQRGAQVLATLHGLEKQVQEIPAQVRAQWTATRAEVSRLNALLEGEQEAKTSGLDKVAGRLKATEAEIERALDALAQATPAEIPTVVGRADEALQGTLAAIEECDRLLSATAAVRSGAEDLVTRVESTLHLAQERWEGLKARGATEPAIARALAELGDATARLLAATRERTVEAYRAAIDSGKDLDANLQALMAQLDALDEVISRSKEAIEGDVQALAQAQTLHDTLVRQDSLLEPDQGLMLIEKATEAYAEAERQRGLGTVAGYEASMALSQTAMQSLDEAQKAAALLPDRALRVRESLKGLSPDVLGEWRTRAERIREELKAYPRHWEKGLAADAAEAVSSLDQVEVDLERVSPNVRYLRRFRQSELAEAADILAHAQGCLARAEELVAALEAEHQRIEQQREDLDQGLEQLAGQVLPELEQLAGRMLPELAQRVQDLKTAFSERADALRDAAQVNYDEAVGEWLPSFSRQVEAVQMEHENSVGHYRVALRDAIGRIDRQWARLNRFDPHAQPGPEDDMEQLIEELNAWRAEAEKQADNPRALRDLVGARAEALEQRLITAYQQISEGRRALEALDRQYRRYSQAARTLKTTIREMQQRTQWPQLTWATADADRIWEQVSELERESHAARTLSEAGDRLQKATTAAQQAEQLYARTEHLMSSTLRRLDDEARAANAALARGARRAEALNNGGDTEAAAALQEHLDGAQHAIELAQAATTFEDALRHLRDAREILG